MAKMTTAQMFEALTKRFDSFEERITKLEDSKKSTTSSSKKSNGKKSKKSDDNFDRNLYEATAKKLGCLGKNGVWKSCRKFVYAVMDGEMTEAKAKAEVKAYVAKQGW